MDYAWVPVTNRMNVAVPYKGFKLPIFYRLFVWLFFSKEDKEGIKNKISEIRKGQELEIKGIYAAKWKLH